MHLMCGIAGIFKLDDNYVNDKELKLLTESLNHRGPDNTAIYIEKNKKLGLGHTRTAILDTSQFGHQPMSYEDERYWISFNGAIYNFIEIKKELESLGKKFVSNSDTEVILAAYSHWGEECVYKFNGDWAFAIWDNKEKNLFLSCDRFSTKNLYYLKKKNYFIFASELKSFMSLNEMHKPDFDNGYFAWLGKNNGCQNTFFKNVFSLLGGHQININQKNIIKFKKWWSTKDNLVQIPKKYEDQVSQFKEIFSNACKIRLRSDVPIASSLSGGVDSSSIVTTISKLLENKNERQYENKQNVFICDFVGDNTSEKKFAENVIKDKNITPFFLDILPSSIDYDELIKASFHQELIEEPAIGPWLIYKNIRNSGIRVSIEGHSADESLAGYAPYIDQLAIDTLSLFKNSQLNDLRNIRKNLKKDEDSDIFSNKYKLIFKSFIGKNNFSFLSKIKNVARSNIKKVNNNEEFFSIEKTESVFPKFDYSMKSNSLHKMLYNDFHYFITPKINQKFDRLSMSHGVEIRSPFLDVNLIKFIFSLPSESKIGNGYTKRILRDSMKKDVPHNVLFRKDKKGFTPSNIWKKSLLNKFINQFINDSIFLNSNIFDGKKIKKEYEDDNMHINYIWRFIQIAIITSKMKEISIKNNRL